MQSPGGRHNPKKTKFFAVLFRCQQKEKKKSQADTSSGGAGQRCTTSEATTTRRARPNASTSAKMASARRPMPSWVVEETSAMSAPLPLSSRRSLKSKTESADARANLGAENERQRLPATRLPTRKLRSVRASQRSSDHCIRHI